MKEVNVGVIGLGFVGLPLSILFTNKGYVVYGFDTDLDKITRLKNGESYIADVSNAHLLSSLKNKRFIALSPSAKIKDVQYIVVTVPTPFNMEKMEPDLSAIIKAAEFISDNLVPNQTIIFESSTYPGTLEEIILPVLLKSGLIVGQDFFLGYSPERIDPGNKTYKMEQIPKVVSGYTPRCKEKVSLFYSKIFNEIVPVSSPKVAEMAKLFENTQRLVNISLVNEIHLICQKMNIDFREAIRAASTKPFGFTPYHPGPGIGGHCIPVDPLYFQWKASQFGECSKIIQIAHDINKAMPMEIVKLIMGHLSSFEKDQKSILLIGLTYKKDVKDVRESPALKIFELLLNKSIKIDYFDPLLPTVHLNNQTYHSVQLSKNLIQEIDTVVILTEHSGIDWNMISQNASYIIDTRGIISNLPSDGSDKK